MIFEPIYDLVVKNFCFSLSLPLLSNPMLRACKNLPLADVLNRLIMVDNCSSLHFKSRNTHIETERTEIPNFFRLTDMIMHIFRISKRKYGSSI